MTEKILLPTSYGTLVYLPLWDWQNPLSSKIWTLLHIKWTVQSPSLQNIGDLRFMIFRRPGFRDPWPNIGVYIDPLFDFRCVGDPYTSNVVHDTTPRDQCPTVGIVHRWIILNSVLHFQSDILLYKTSPIDCTVETIVYFRLQISKSLEPLIHPVEYRSFF